MTEFTFWYKNTVKASDISEAIRKEKKLKPSLSSIQQEDEPKNEEKTPLIGYQVYQESDYE